MAPPRGIKKKHLRESECPQAVHSWGASLVPYPPSLRLFFSRHPSTPHFSSKRETSLIRRSFLLSLESVLVLSIVGLCCVLVLYPCQGWGPPSSASSSCATQILGQWWGVGGPESQSTPRGTPVNESTGIPGSRLRTVEEVFKFRQHLECVSAQGQWEENPTPRVLPWPLDDGNFGHCDGHWTWTPGRISHKAADDVARSHGPASAWAVRPSLKYEWRVEEAMCGAGAGITPWDGRELSRVLLLDPDATQTAPALPAASAPALPATERVIMFVGDSMQHAYAVSFYDNMRMDVDAEHATEEVVPLQPESLPCFVKALAHRRMCWGAHLNAKSQPGAKLVFVRNDFLTLVDQATWGRDGKHFQLPWIETVKALVQADYQWQEGGRMRFPGQRKADSEEESFRPSPRGAKTLPPVLVLNKGVHFVEDSIFYSGLNDSMQAARRMCPQCILIFRNTPAATRIATHTTCPLLRSRLRQNCPSTGGE